MKITKIAYNFLPSNGGETTIEIFDSIVNTCYLTPLKTTILIIN